MTEGYAPTNRINYLANFPGARVERDVVAAVIEGGEVDIVNRANRSLGKVSLVDAPTLDTDIAAALVSDGSETLQVQHQGDVATETTLSTIASAAASDGSETLQVDQQGVVDVSSRDGRNLGDVDVTDLPDADVGEFNAAALSGSGDVTADLTAPGADTLRGRVVSTGSYDVDVEHKASDGTVLFTDSVASGVAGGTATSINVSADSAYLTVRVTDTSTNAQTVDGSLNLG